MSVVDRAKLHRDIDELDDEQFAEFLRMLRPSIEKKAQEGQSWAKNFNALYEQVGKDDPNPNATAE